MEIKTSTFALSSPTLESCPKDFKPEYAFIGRSNVGKSSLINMLCNHKGLAKTSSTPGKTLLINHFLINHDWYLVDLPGYGFAKRSKSVQQKIQNMISSYLRLEPQAIDREFINWLGQSSIPFSIVFTKADKLSNMKAQESVKRFMDALREEWEELPPYFVTSSEKRTGREELLAYIDSINKDIAQP